jgi:hypothetical protein
MARVGGKYFLGRSRPYAAIGWGGSIAGVLDIASAAVMVVMKGGSIPRMLQGIAFGLIGPKTFHGGMATALLGLACHFVIAFGAAAIYYLASRGIPVLVRHATICGLLYGIPVYIVTNYVVIPLSRIGRILPHPNLEIFISMVILMVLVGLPIGLATRRYS